MTKPFKSVIVIGAGTMGAGIAQVLAQSGLTTWLTDIDEPKLQQALNDCHRQWDKQVEKQKMTAEQAQAAKAGLSISTDLDACLPQADGVIEAIVEDLDVKRQLFARCDALLPPHAIICSNTSSLSITAMAASTKRPEQVAGLHFFNPAPIMKLVEIVMGEKTSPDTLASLKALAEQLNKTAVVAKDSPGFIVNRVARAFYGESLRLLDENAGSIETIDGIMRDEGGFKMGPFELMDLIGIDINWAVTQSVYHAYCEEARFKPHPIQHKKVMAGQLGRKTGEGFYKYER